MMRYSEIPRDISGDSIPTAFQSEVPEELCNSNRQREKTRNSYSTNGELAVVHKSGFKYKYNIIHTTTSPKKESLPNVATNPDFRLSSSENIQLQSKSHSLPNHGSIVSSAASGGFVMDTLHASAEDFASQLTHLDFIPFAAIEPDELTSCGWNKKNKLVIAPNVVAFTRRFNHVSFWTVQEILSRPTPKQRSEILAHFIRIARKLYELNNLHSLFAIISALQSVSVYRLSKTWSGLSKKDKQHFEKLAEVFSDNNNWLNLREHMESLKLPCIPYLGLFLTDLVYIDMAHPHSGGLESQQRLLKMNNILRVIANYQNSNYSHLPILSHIQHYLKSIRYIEELQKFVEDDQYKLSLKLEPPSAGTTITTGILPSGHTTKELLPPKSSVIDSGVISSLNLSPAKASCGSLRLQNAVSQSTKFIPGHRKSRSLGSNIFHKCHQTNSVDPNDSQQHQQSLHLLDDSVMEETLSIETNSGIIDDKQLLTNLPRLTLAAACISDDKQLEEDKCNLLFQSLVDDDQSDDDCAAMLSSAATPTIQGCIRRKTLQKDGRKPTVAAWQKYWLQLWASSLVYFSPKSFKANSRSDFKREPCKMVSIAGWNASMGENSSQPDLFQLTDPFRKNIYKFRAGSQIKAEKWCRHLHQAASLGEQKPLPANLMLFD